MILIPKEKYAVLVAAAGKGSRSGLPYPKTLFEIKKQPILIRLLNCLRVYDPSPIIIVSPDGHPLISRCLEQYDLIAELIIQESALGMGDAVLKAEDSKRFHELEHLILVWGDIPFLQASTLETLVRCHQEDDNDFSFITAKVEQAYTQVLRDETGRVLRVDETRNALVKSLRPGERDIGLFMFKKAVVWPLLRGNYPEKYSPITHEHGFLYVIHLLVKLGYKVQGYPMAKVLDLISLNYLADVSAYI